MDVGPDVVHGRPHLPDLSRLADLDRVGIDLGALADDLARSADPTRLDTGGAGGHPDGTTGGSRLDGRSGAGDGPVSRSERAFVDVAPPAQWGIPDGAHVASADVSGPSTASVDADGARLAGTATVDHQAVAGPGQVPTGPGSDPQAPVDRGTPEARAPGSDRGTPAVSRVDLLAPGPTGSGLSPGLRRPRVGLRRPRRGWHRPPPRPIRRQPNRPVLVSFPCRRRAPSRRRLRADHHRAQSGPAGPTPRPGAGEPRPDRSVGDGPGWRSRGTLTPDQVRAADALVQQARAAEPRITASVADIAQTAGGRLLGDTERLKPTDSVQRKLAEKLAGDVPLREALATMKDSVRYTIGLPHPAYAAGVETALSHLVEQGFRPVDFRSRWNGSGTGGHVTTWSDPHTSQLFEIQFHTDASYHATHATTTPSLAGLRLPAGPGDSTSGRHHPAFVPDGASAIRLPGDTPAADPLLAAAAAQRPDAEQPGAEQPGAEQPDAGSASRDEVDDWELADDEALELAYDTLLVTDAGLAFYAVDDDIREFATAVHPTDGFVTIDLHGAPDSFEIDGFLLSPEQFAGALRHLRDQGLLELPSGVGIKLMSCDTAVGGPDSAAATLARELGVVVVAPDQPVWTTRNGEEIVSSATLVDGRWAPTDPPDGDWHAFDATGDEIPLNADSVADNPSSRAAEAADGHWEDAGDGRWDGAAVRASDPTASDGMRASWAHDEWPIGADGRPRRRRPVASGAGQRSRRPRPSIDVCRRCGPVGGLTR